MAIRILVGEHDRGMVRFTVSPLTEAALSLNAYLFPRERPLQHPWLRAMRGLAPALRREIRAFGWTLDWALPDCLLPLDPDAASDWDAELARVASLEPRAAAYDLARPAFFYVTQAPPGEQSLAEPDVRAQIAGRARRHGAAAVRLAELLYEDPSVLLSRFVEMLDSYWRAAFAGEWARIGPSLADAARADAARMAREGIYSVIDGPFTDTIVDRRRGAIVRKSPHEHTVTATADRSLILVPSLYVWPHTRVNCDEPWPLALIYPPASIRAAARPEPVSSALSAGLRALADPTRLQALRLMVERPRTTEELAPLLGLSRAGTSKHLRSLAEAGLVTRRRDGWYVLYSVERGRLEQIAAHISALGHRRRRP